MWVHPVMFGVISFGSLILCVSGQKMLGAGKWTVLNVQPCARDAEMPWRLRVRRHKLNRTHDCFDAEFSVEDTLDDSCGIRLDVCKMMDGGCKPYMVQEDDNLPNFLKKYASENVKVVLGSAGLDPPDFPIPKGEYSVQNFMLDLEELPEDGIYGQFGVDGYVVKNGEDVACAQLSVKYDPVDGEDGGSSPYG